MRENKGDLAKARNVLTFRIKVWVDVGSTHLVQEDEQEDCPRGSHLQRLLDLLGTSGA